MKGEKIMYTFSLGGKNRKTNVKNLDQAEMHTGSGNYKRGPKNFQAPIIGPATNPLKSIGPLYNLSDTQSQQVNLLKNYTRTGYMDKRDSSFYREANPIGDSKRKGKHYKKAQTLSPSEYALKANKFYK